MGDMSYFSHIEELNGRRFGLLLVTGDTYVDHPSRYSSHWRWLQAWIHGGCDCATRLDESGSFDTRMNEEKLV